LPEDIAGVIALLWSKDGAWIDAQTLFANGSLG
jgi:3-oxoacyl-[acyl-carrier protein] reductase